MSFIHGRVGTLNVNGEATPVYFNLNTCAYFDEHSKNRLIPMLMKVISAVQKAGGSLTEEISVKLVFEHIDFPTIRLLAAAALHRYDSNGEPIHPYTPGQLGGCLGIDEWGKLVPMLQKGAMDFLAGRKDLPKSLQNEDDDRPNPTEVPTPPSDGGTGSSDLDAAILDSLESSSDEKPSGDSSSDGKPENKTSSEKNSEPAASTP